MSKAGVAGTDAQRRFVTSLLAGFALCALLLAAIGLYGVVAYSVSQRSREIGIRIALGATRRGIARLVVVDSVTFVVLGAAAGALTSVLFSRLIRSMLFHTTTTDMPTFGVVAAALAVVALAASYVPARRAARTDPLIAIRAE